MRRCLPACGRLTSHLPHSSSQHVRAALGIEPGDALEFEVRGNEFVGRKKPQADSGIDWDGVYGVVDFGGRSADEIMQELRPVRAWDDQ